ncbi:uncharacterized protein LOC131005694 [Salvia miltiorrhiza]|uniref:uncharacterized protein LOC131005694 n=1 Tax=Salvia miltiorrhiza TaxID=226208 RepID=UPI0025AD810A|nr:uncharacterized protein LOC131005694 [Salvia miltiorrhiza]
MASSSAHHPFAATAAPPPTPSFDSNLSSASTSSDFLSNLLHRLPPTLSLSHRSSPLSSSSTATATPPVVSLSDPTPSLLSASTEHGFFHLTHHPIPSDLPLSAESTALSLFALPHHQKQLLFPTNWPLGHEIDDDGDGESFCLDSSFPAESTGELNFDCLREFTTEMEKLGLKVLEELASAVGFDNPARNELCSLLWISDGAGKPGRVYPYAVGLHYQIRCRKQTLLMDSGRVTVSGLADSVLVTLGDIAQVWSNGRVKKVRGRPFPSSCNEKPNCQCITMSLLITLPGESTVCPLLRNLIDDEDNDDNGEGEKRLFNSFSLEDYAWRVYHQPLLLKDPLLRYCA